MQKAAAVYIGMDDGKYSLKPCRKGFQAAYRFSDKAA